MSSPPNQPRHQTIRESEPVVWGQIFVLRLFGHDVSLLLRESVLARWAGVVLLRQHLAASARPSVAVRRASSEHLCVSSPHFPGGELLVTAKNCFVEVIQFSDQSSFHWQKWMVVY